LNLRLNPQGDCGPLQMQVQAYVYFVEREEMSLSTNNSRKRNSRGRFRTSVLGARRAPSFLPLEELRIFMANQFSIACASPHQGDYLCGGAFTAISCTAKAYVTAPFL
jgi:hypothetical protein